MPITTFADASFNISSEQVYSQTGVGCAIGIEVSKNPTFSRFTGLVRKRAESHIHLTELKYWYAPTEATVDSI